MQEFLIEENLQDTLKHAIPIDGKLPEIGEEFNDSSSQEDAMEPKFSLQNTSNVKEINEKLKNLYTRDRARGVFVCKVCGKEFKQRKNLLYHIRNTHENPTKHKCEKCHQIFAHRVRNYLGDHQKSPLGD